MNENKAGDDEVELPPELKVGRFAQARVKEILGLQAYINEPRQGQAASQQLPRHLRRRAVSHNPKRLPKRLRERHIREREKSGCKTGAVGKRPSRKYRRRPRNLLDEYNRRQKKFVWLETHIWHAKRFHMVNRWGYKIAEHPNDKSARSCYRASSKRCLMTDISYMPAMELVGLEESLLQKLSSLTSDRVSRGFNAPEYLNGSREGRAWLYQPGKYPFGVLGEVTFLWKTVSSNENNQQRTLWLWTHPACYVAIKEAIVSVFQCKMISQGADIVSSTLKKLENRNIPFQRVPRLQGEDGVILSLLKDTLVRFRLIGPLSSVVLAKSLGKTEVKSSSDSELWWQKFYNDPVQLRVFEEQQNVLEKLSSMDPGCVPSGAVLGFTVRDPRCILPTKRGEVVNDLNVLSDNKVDEEFHKSCISKSPIWLPDVRDEVSQKKTPDHELNKKRSAQLLVPGSELELDEAEARIPVLLVQQPGCPQSNFGCGWDVIVPAGWGVPFWMNFVFRGAVACGLRDVRCFHLEKNFLHPLEAIPDSTAGQEDRLREKEIVQETHFRHPPDKRCNFVKIGITSPFDTPWEGLIKDYTENGCFYVIREPSSLLALKKALFEGQIPSSLSNHSNGLIPIRLELVSRGTLSARAIICKPGMEDLESNDDLKKGPTEPNHDDCTEERKRLRAKHQKTLLDLRRQWKIEKDKLVQLKAESVAERKKLDQQVVRNMKEKINRLKASREQEVKNYADKMRNLWVPEKIDNVKESCSRTVIGFVTNGNFSYRIGKMVGLGFIAASAFKVLFQKDTLQANQRSLVLVRETHSAQYNFAQISINENASGRY